MDILVIQNLFIGFAVALLVCFLAFKSGLLTKGGAWTAWLIGGLTFGLGGLSWATLLILFFLSSSVIPFIRNIKGGSKKKIKPNRNWKQVLVNGGPGLIVLLFGFFSGANEIAWSVYCGIIAAVTADTWATELGILSKKPPRKITTWKIEERGSSGAVSVLGFGAAFCGSLLIGIAAYIFEPMQDAFVFISIIVVSGFLGALIDSILGATIQAQYLDIKRQLIVEVDGKDHKLIRGFRIVDNDVVNLVCAFIGGLTAFLILL